MPSTSIFTDSGVKENVSNKKSLTQPQTRRNCVVFLSLTDLRPFFLRAINLRGNFNVNLWDLTVSVSVSNSQWMPR